MKGGCFMDQQTEHYDVIRSLSQDMRKKAKTEAEAR